jgi:4-amino-4-deoxy-L-arabinose transferase-like glycosyltransferase
MNFGTSLLKEPNRTVGALLLGGLLVRLIIAIFLYPGFDEAYYYLYSRYLSWSYFDHPPLVALTTGFGWWLTGIISPFTLRLGALLLYTLSLWLLYRVGSRLFSAAVGRMALAIATLTPLFMIGFGILTSPDNALILFWTLTLYWAVVEFFPTDSAPTSSAELQPYVPTWRLSLFGVWVGLACLGKYHGFVLALSLVGFCLFSRRYRRVFTSPWTLLAFVLFGLTLLPLLYWNAQHDWISFRFQLSMRFDGSSDSSFNLGQLLLYAVVIVAYLFPGFGFPLWWTTGRQLLGQLRSRFGPAANAQAVDFAADLVGLYFFRRLPANFARMACARLLGHYPAAGRLRCRVAAAAPPPSTPLALGIWPVFGRASSGGAAAHHHRHAAAARRLQLRRWLGRP